MDRLRIVLAFDWRRHRAARPTPSSATAFRRLVGVSFHSSLAWTDPRESAIAQTLGEPTSRDSRPVDPALGCSRVRTWAYSHPPAVESRPESLRHPTLPRPSCPASSSGRMDHHWSATPMVSNANPSSTPTDKAPVSRETRTSTSVHDPERGLHWLTARPSAPASGATSRASAFEPMSSTTAAPPESSAGSATFPMAPWKPS